MNFPDSRVLSDEFPRRKYKPSSATRLEDIVLKGLHYGQRKLLLSEIEFLSAYLEGRQAGAKPTLVVYAGAANGSHLPFLFQLFEAVKFVLIDPAPFCDAVREISLNKQGPILDLVQGFCTDELCKQLSSSYGSTYDILLVSDIRSGVPEKQSNRENTLMIMRDNDMQRSWCWTLKAEAALLKFHPPYPPCRDRNSRHYDEADDTPESIEYLDGVRLFGVWAPKSSSELRLCVQGPFLQGTSFPMRRYDCTTHEEQCYFYNTDNRYTRDCAAESGILERYLQLFPSAPYSDPTALSMTISNFLGFPLFLPLDSSFSESDARWVTLLYSTRIPTCLELFTTLRGRVTHTVMKQLAEEWQSATTVPKGVSIDSVELTSEFWKAVCAGDLTEAYSFPNIRWRFANLLISRRRKRSASDRAP
ncbi:poly A polymerase regulatory subunit, putative [Trypanosoma equiperdum]|uniref:Cap-specific mRNA (nucleoside-2'-O-)-methyltransferase n=2 Tax=Trypanozoon TaxID=39700 RepID=Q385S9_TRYB2|nr:hypothetical protein, conserved [Trypanosoma brucei brucei TREU927]EAN79452.1 hypothetical protein, conserved [Trypanosoma brucei brucei TREU927]SCU66422.1 poly A polymerase regulatory subunit, putative [Trypanosoma equiperdum]